MSDKLARPLAARVANLTAPTAPDEGAVAPQSLLNGAIAALDAGKTKYTDRPGIIGLRQWVSDHLHDQYNIEVEPNAVTMTCGITEARYVALKYFTDQRPEPILPTTPPKPGQVKGIGTLLERDTQAYPVPDHRYAVIYYDEPSGVMAYTWQMALRHDIPIIWEATVGHTIDFLAYPALLNQTLIIGDCFVGDDGWRVGWMAGHADHAKLRSFKQSMTICTPSASQWATLAMLEAQS